MHLSRLDVNINAYHCHDFIFFINITSINSNLESFIVFLGKTLGSA